MEFVKIFGYEDVWNEFCLDNPRAWFFHTAHWLEYLMHSKFHTKFKNHSFFVQQNNEITNIVPLIQENDELISPGFDDKKEILAEIKRIALENRIKRIQVSSGIRSYLSIPFHTCILNLNNVTPSKGHLSAIKKAEKYLQYKECDLVGRFKSDYFRIAGKQTRPDETFECLSEWLWKDFITILEAQFDGKTAGYVVILRWKDKAYYMMSCVKPAYREYNVTHFLLWKSFEILRSKNIKYIDMGEQVSNSLYSQPSEKEFNISRFKKGFGGQIMISPLSEYFFDKEYLKTVMSERLKYYIRSEYE